MRPHLYARRMGQHGHLPAHRRRVFLAIAILVLIAVAFGSGPGTSLASDDTGAIVVDGAGRISLGQNAVTIKQPVAEMGGQTYFDGLTVESGQSLEGDVVVWSGDAVVEGGGRIGGSLVVYQGDVDVQSGGSVDADITAWAGDVKVDGRVGGNISAISGNVDLGDGATVDGDVSTLSGDIDRSDSARIGGNIVRGPSIAVPQGILGKDVIPGFGGQAPTAPEAPVAPEAPEAPEAPVARVEMGRSVAAQFFGLMARLFFAALSTLFVTLAAVVVYSLRPLTVQQVQDKVRANPARAFALGITVNMALWLAFFIFSRAWCLAILAIVPGLVLVFINLIGFTVVSRILGQRLGGALSALDRRPVIEVALGAILIAAILNFLPGLFGGGSGVFFGLVALFVTAPGVGAFVQPFLENYRNRRGQNLSSPGKSAPAASVPSAPQPPSVTPVSPVVPVQPAQPVEPVVVLAPQASVQPAPPAARMEDAVLTPVEGAAAVSTGPAPSLDAEPVKTDQSAAEAPYAFVLPETPAPASEGPGLTLDEVVQQADAERKATEAAAQAAREQALAAAALAGDDFTRIAGIGKAGDRRLKAAGITRFAQLAAMPVEMIASVIGTGTEMVLEDEIVKQASDLAHQAG